MKARWNGLDEGRRCAALAVLDQCLNGGSSILLGLVVARAVTAEEFGAFAVGFAVYGVLLGVSRAYGTDALLARHSASNLSSQRRAARAALGAATATGLVAGLALVVAGFVADGTVGGVCIAFGIALPGLLAHEAYRHVFSMTRSPELTVLVDATWLGAFVAFLLLPGLRGADDPVSYVLGWGLAAVVAAVLAMVGSETDPRVERARAWRHENRDLTPRFALDRVVASSGFHVVAFASAVILGLAASAALRGAFVVMGPVWVLGAAVVAAAGAAEARVRDRSLATLRVQVAVLVALLAAASVAWGALTAGLSTAHGEAALGDTWALAQPLLAPLGICGAGVLASAGLVAGLRALAASRLRFVFEVPTGLLVIVAGIAGAAVGDARTVVVAMIVPTWLTVLVVAEQFRRASRSPAGKAGQPAADAA